MRLRVTAVNVDGTVASYSNAVGPVGADAPAMLVAPTVTGQPAHGYTLSSHLGRWTGAGSTYAYQWQRNTGSGYVDIAGARGSSYRLQAADVGATLRLKLVVSNPDGRIEYDTGGVGPVR